MVLMTFASCDDGDAARLMCHGEREGVRKGENKIRKVTSSGSSEVTF